MSVEGELSRIADYLRGIEQGGIDAGRDIEIDVGGVIDAVDSLKDVVEEGLESLDRHLVEIGSTLAELVKLMARGTAGPGVQPDD